tara:strand:- start:3985 stop:4932 length:948 start_codon:yes stop_codon:yes gene_type:complete
MATTTSQISELYADVVADLIPYYDDAVLLPNPSLIVNSYNLSGAIGNQMKIPLTNSYPDGNVAIAENSDLINAGFDFNPTSATLSVSKKSAGSTISEEALEDGGMDTVRNALVTRLSRSIAQATDVEGMRVMLSGGTSALTDIANINVSNDGNTAGQITTADLAVVFSNEAMGYAIKRDPSVKMFNDIQNDNHDFVATLRNGFAQIRSNFIRAVATQSGVGSSTASLAQFSQSVANLRSQNAPADVGGFYYAVVTPAQELALASELNGVGGIAGGAISSVSQDLANQALLEGLIGQAVGLRFVRSNNLPSGIASA